MGLHRNIGSGIGPDSSNLLYFIVFADWLWRLYMTQRPSTCPMSMKHANLSSWPNKASLIRWEWAQWYFCLIPIYFKYKAHRPGWARWDLSLSHSFVPKTSSSTTKWAERSSMEINLVKLFPFFSVRLLLPLSLHLIQNSHILFLPSE